MMDMPKPAKTFRGPAFEVLSSNDLRVANAMWEATMAPMSVFDDFESGNVDYDKVQYAWKQYPGLKMASQAGLMDILHSQLDDDGRASVPESMLTQLDYLFDMKGTLQESLDAGFAQRMSQAAAQEAKKGQQKPPPGGMLAMNTAEPTFTERISGRK